VEVIGAQSQWTRSGGGRRSSIGDDDGGWDSVFMSIGDEDGGRDWFDSLRLSCVLVSFAIVTYAAMPSRPYCWPLRASVF
jgi:hypothetical protein